MKIYYTFIVLLTILAGYGIYGGINEIIQDKKDFIVICEEMGGEINKFKTDTQCIIHYDGYYTTYTSLRQIQNVHFIINNF